MHCIHINIRKAAFILLSLLANNVHKTQTTDNKTQDDKNNTTEDVGFSARNSMQDIILECPPDMPCKSLPVPCISCSFNYSCYYGRETSVTCSVKPQVKCLGETEFNRTFVCRFCYQTPHWEHDCLLKAHRNSAGPPPSTYITNCTVKSEVLCLGKRTFNKNLRYNWTGGHSWSTALALSITLGGFGADRFYLGHWQEGIGKLFSFGGLGVWTIIDVILISLHYLGPADGSLYI